jgi:hypothetical protein
MASRASFGVVTIWYQPWPGASSVRVDTVAEVERGLKLPVGGVHIVAVVDLVDHVAQRLVVDREHDHQPKAALDGAGQPLLVDGLVCDAVPPRPAVELRIPAHEVPEVRKNLTFRLVDVAEHVPDQVIGATGTMDDPGRELMREVAPSQRLFHLPSGVAVEGEPTKTQMSELVVVDVRETASGHGQPP